MFSCLFEKCGAALAAFSVCLRLILINSLARTTIKY